jgi:hypothetical protein
MHTRQVGQNVFTTDSGHGEWRSERNDESGARGFDSRLGKGTCEVNEVCVSAFIWAGHNCRVEWLADLPLPKSLFLRGVTQNGWRPATD